MVRRAAYVSAQQRIQLLLKSTNASESAQTKALHKLVSQLQSQRQGTKFDQVNGEEASQAVANPEKICHAEEYAEYSGELVKSGEGHVQPSAAACCKVWSWVTKAAKSNFDLLRRAERRGRVWTQPMHRQCVKHPCKATFGTDEASHHHHQCTSYTSHTWLPLSITTGLPSRARLQRVGLVRRGGGLRQRAGSKGPWRVLA